MRALLTATLTATLTAAALALSGPASAATAVDSTGTTYSTDRVVVPITFPVLGATSYSDNFLSCRSGCTRKHMGQDLMGAKMSPLVAACTGTVVTLKRETRVGDGNYLGIACETGAAKGWSVMYLHVNNDTPGTDDGKGTAKWAFPAGIAQGVRVLQGQLVGWRGDSGNAESTGPHLHFELRKGSGWSGIVYNAYPSLRAAHHIATPSASGPHPDGTLVRSSTGALLVLRNGRSYPVSNPVRTANGLPWASSVLVSAAELALYPRAGALPLQSGSLVRDPAGAVWRVSGSSRFPTAQLPGQVVTAVTAADLAGLPVVAAPTSPFFPGLLLSVDGVLKQVGDDRLLHRVSAPVAASWGLRAANAVVPPVDAALPPTGADLALRDGTLAASTTALGVVSRGVFRRIWDHRELVAYGYADKPRVVVPATMLQALPTGEIAGPVSTGWRG